MWVIFMLQTRVKNLEATLDNSLESLKILAMLIVVIKECCIDAVKSVFSACTKYG